MSGLVEYVSTYQIDRYLMYRTYRWRRCNGAATFTYVINCAPIFDLPASSSRHQHTVRHYSAFCASFIIESESHAQISVRNVESSVARSSGRVVSTLFGIDLANSLYATGACRVGRLSHS